MIHTCSPSTAWKSRESEAKDLGEPGALSLGKTTSPNAYILRHLSDHELQRLAKTQAAWKEIQQVYQDPCRTAQDWQDKMAAAMNIISAHKPLNLPGPLLILALGAAGSLALGAAANGRST